MPTHATSLRERQRFFDDIGVPDTTEYRNAVWELIDDSGECIASAACTVVLVCCRRGLHNHGWKSEVATTGSDPLSLSSVSASWAIDPLPNFRRENLILGGSNRILNVESYSRYRIKIRFSVESRGQLINRPAC